MKATVLIDISAVMLFQGGCYTFLSRFNSFKTVLTFKMIKYRSETFFD